MGERIANNKKLIAGLFEGSTLNTPSMICVEDSIDSLNWVKRIGGLNALIKRSNKSFNFVSEWISKTTWVDFMCADPSARSNTGITFQINDIHCEKCVEKIRQALENLAGLEEVHINLDEKIIKIEGEADPLEIQKIIQEVGYTPVQLQKENNQL